MGNTCNCIRNLMFSKFRPELDKNEAFVTRLKKDNNESQREYFEMIKHRLTSIYLDNQENHFNIPLSLEKKDFNSIISNKSICINPNQTITNWIEFLKDYSVKQSKRGYPWAKNLKMYK